MHVYLKARHEELWTVGFYMPNGAWHPVSDHTSEADAQWAVHFLNGGSMVRDTNEPDGDDYADRAEWKHRL